VSVINKMLQELDRRDALSSPNAEAPPRQVRAVEAARGREWFWRIVGTLMLAAVAWVGWVAYQLQPRLMVTEKALKAADEARANGARALAVPPQPAQTVQAVPPPAAVPTPQAPPPAAIATEPKPAPEIAPVAKEESRAVVSAPVPPKKTAAPRRSTKSAPSDILLALNLPPARVLPHFPQKTNVQRRERTSASDRAEREFRLAVELLKQGRASEAEDGFVAGLAQDPSHHGARQALVALNLERGQLEPARRLLQDGLAPDPAQPDFAFALARILIERRSWTEQPTQAPSMASSTLCAGPSCSNWAGIPRPRTPTGKRCRLSQPCPSPG
jgi:TolA-binding protein